MPKEIGAVILDFDGVVANTVGDIFSAIRWLLEEGGVPFCRLPSFPDFLKTFSLPADESYLNWGLSLPPAKLNQRFQEIFSTHYEKWALLYPGVRTALSQLRRLGFNLALISGAPSQRAETFLARHELSEFFDWSCLAQDDKTEALKQACQFFACRPERAVFVGDMISDMRDGQRAGVIPVGFASGFPFMPAALTEAGAWYCIDQLDKLQAILTSLSSQTGQIKKVRSTSLSPL